MIALLERIAALAAASSPLDPGPERRAALREAVERYAERFLSDVADRPAYRHDAEEGRGIRSVPIGEEPVPAERLMDLLARHVDGHGANLGSGGYLGFVPASSAYPSALADYLSTATNLYSGSYYGAPGAIRIEHMLLAWMADFLGYPATSAGNLTSGGSIANLSAVVTAREARGLRAADVQRAVVYLSDQTHHSVTKALRIAGVGEAVHRRVELDGRWRIVPEALDAAIRRDQAAGLRPWLVVAAAGSTDAGAVDPMANIAEVAREHGLWLHVDGAYGATFALCAEGKAILAGIERADSITLDPHKGLFVPCGTGAILVRDGRALRSAFATDANYLRDLDVLSSQEETSPSDLSPELTRPFRGLRLWLPLQLAGVAPFRAALEEKLLLARYAHERLRSMSGFVVGPPPDLSIVTFRHEPPRGDANRFNEALAAAVVADGRIFLTTTTLRGEVTLRLAILNLRTHRETVDLALELLERKARELSA